MPIKISPNRLAEFMSIADPSRKKTFVARLYREAQAKKKDFPFPYPAFATPAKRFLASGTTDERVVLAAIERMATRTGKPWLIRDSKNTAAAFKALLAIAPQVSALGVAFKPCPARQQAPIQFADVVINVAPDAMVEGERNGVPLEGALRFYVAKGHAFELGPDAARRVAAMQWHWLVTNWKGARTPDPSLCVVLECFQQRITAAPADPQPLLVLIERACYQFSAIWHGLDAQEAA
jgi:hypothetical protein